MYEAKLTDVTRISPDVRQYQVELIDGELEGNHGQHVVISKPDGFTKPYTPIVLEESRLVFMIRNKKTGGVSEYMAQLETGDTIDVGDNVGGNLHLKDPSRPVALISTGTGITPMLGILSDYIEYGEKDVEFVFGDKNTDHLLYKSMLEQYEVRHNLNATYVLSRESWHGREGYVQEHIDDIIDDTHEETERDFYVCGVPPMVVATKERLSELGVPKNRIHSEGWEDSVVN